MAPVFWDAHGILFIDYLKKGKTINIDYYMALLDRLIERTREFGEKMRGSYKRASSQLNKGYLINGSIPG